VTAPSRLPAEQLVSAFVVAIEGKSLRDVEKITGLSHQMIAEYRRGARPAHLRRTTREAMMRYLRSTGWEPSAGISDRTRARVLELEEQLRAAVWAGEAERARELAEQILEALE
jgi:hypothetical protein